MTDLEIQEYIEINCRNEHGEPMMDEQTFYEGAKWYRDKVVNKSNIPVVVNSVCPDPTHHAMEIGLMEKCSTCGATE